MLNCLRIKNLALIEDATVEFESGFNAITGETGAGKSILIGALNLLLGERADRTVIRSGCESCSVEGLFDVSSLEPQISEFLQQNGIEGCESNQLLIKRTITVSGSTRQFINGSPVTLNILSALGDLLVDIHGPHAHQSLLSESCQLEILDSFAKLEKEKQEYQEALKALQGVEAQIQSLVMDEKEFARQLDMLRFQVNEIESAKLKEGEDDELEAQYRRASSSAKIAQLCNEAIGILSEGDEAVITRLGAVGRIVQELERLDEQAKEISELQRQCASSINELESLLVNYLEGVELDIDRLREIELRIDLLNSLKRKYGRTVSDVIAYGKEIKLKLQQLENRTEELERLHNERQKLRSTLLKAGEKLTRKRRSAIPSLEKGVSAHLQELGFKQSKFIVQLTGRDPDFNRLSSAGFDEVQFLFAPNPGEPPKPLKAIASSGELARVMLAIKTLLAEHDRVPVLVFDEVDSNVGGETAIAVGEKLLQLGKRHQVLCVTHLPSVASAAEHHFLVTKTVKDGRTLTFFEPVSGERRIQELARMLGGVNETAIRHAKALIQKYRS